MDSQRKQAEAAAMKSREYQITLTDGNRTGIATLRLDGQCVKWLEEGGTPRIVVEGAMEWLLTGKSASDFHVRDIPDEPDLATVRVKYRDVGQLPPMDMSDESEGAK